MGLIHGYNSTRAHFWRRIIYLYAIDSYFPRDQVFASTLPTLLLYGDKPFSTTKYQNHRPPILTRYIFAADLSIAKMTCYLFELTMFYNLLLNCQSTVGEKRNQCVWSSPRLHDELSPSVCVNNTLLGCDNAHSDLALHMMTKICNNEYQKQLCGSNLIHFPFQSRFNET